MGSADGHGLDDIVSVFRQHNTDRNHAIVAGVGGIKAAVAAAVAQGRADWGIAIAPVAALYGLGFLPIAPEEYDFLLRESRRDRPAVVAFLAALRDGAVRQKIRALGMQMGEA